MSQFPTLSATTPAAISTVGRRPTQNDFMGDITAQSDCVTLAGNAVIPITDAAYRIAKRQQVPLLTSDDIGHPIRSLYDAIAQHSRCSIIHTTGRAEAVILTDIAHQFQQIPGEKIRVEDQPTNCGGNTRLSCASLDQAVESIHTVIVVQDPAIQRRTVAMFQHVTHDKPYVSRWLSFPGFIPGLTQQHNGMDFMPAAGGPQPVERYLSLTTGELPRLRDDATGYGPYRHDFIAYVGIPQDVKQAWLRLKNDTALADLLESRSL